MKKILVILSGIFMVFCFLFINIESRENYLKTEIENDYLGESFQFMVYQHEEQGFTKDDIQYIVDLADKYKVTVFTNTGSTDNIINQFLIINDEKMLNRYHVDSTFNYSDNAVISTDSKLSTTESIKKYDNSTIITKQSFFSEDNTSLDGWYNVYGENKKEFYEEFNEHFPNDTEVIEIHGDEHEVEYLEDTNQDKLVKFGLLFSCSAVVILLLFFSNQSREISIKKMNGYSLLKIIKDSMLKLTIIMFVFDIVITIAMLLLNIPVISSVHIPLMLNLAVAILIKYVVLIFVYLIVLMYIKTISISTLIKRKGISRFIMNLNTVMRVAFVFILSVSIFKMLPEFNNSLRMAFEYNEFIDTCGDYAHSVSVNGFLDEEENLKIDEFTQELQTKDGYFGVYTGNYDNSLDLGYSWIDVNHNYLKKFPIYNIDNNQIINLDINKTYLLVPKEYIENDELYKSSVERMKEFLTFEEIIIEDEQKVFTFNIEHYEGALGYVRQVPILVSNDFSWYNIYFDNPKESDFMEIHKIFEDAGIETTFNYEYAKDEASFIFNSKLSNVIYEGSVILLYIALLTLLIVQYLLLLFDVNRKEYMIKKMNGYSFFNRYTDIVLLLVSSYLINFLLMKFLGYEITAFVVLLIIMLLDMLFTTLVIKHVEKKSISIVLKGD